MKKLITMLAIMMMVFIPNSTTLALDADVDYVIDNGGLLTDAEEVTLLERIEDIRTVHAIDVVVVTMDDFTGNTFDQYMEDFYNDAGYRNNGITIGISMAQRDWSINTFGDAMIDISDSDTDRMSDDIIPYLASAEYYNAFETFLTGVDETMAIPSSTGESGVTDGDEYTPPPTIDSEESTSEDKRMGFIVSLVIALIVSTTTIIIMVAGMNTAKSQPMAHNYMVNKKITHSNDTYLYRRVTKRKKPEPPSSSSSGGGGGGRSSGGSSGNF